MAGTWNYDPALLIGTDPTTLMMQVRTLIADVNPKDQLLWDQQIAFALGQENSNIYLAASDCCLQIAAKFSRDVDITEGSLHRSYSARQKAYADRATELKARGMNRSYGVAYAGGISRQDKRTQEVDTDRVQPAFLRGLTDNWLPVTPVDNELGGGPW